MDYKAELFKFNQNAIIFIAFSFHRQVAFTNGSYKSEVTNISELRNKVKYSLNYVPLNNVNFC